MWNYGQLSNRTERFVSLVKKMDNLSEAVVAVQVRLKLFAHH